MNALNAFHARTPRRGMPVMNSPLALAFCLALGTAGAAVAQTTMGAAGPTQTALAQAKPSLPSGVSGTRLSAANRSSPEQQLQAIRDALLDKAMGAQTRVSATSWVNEKGELLEASQFRTDMQVRGVRVVEYVGGDEPKATVTVDDAAVAEPAAAYCREPGSADPWRHPMGLQVTVHPAQPVALHGASHQVQDWVDRALRQHAGSRGTPVSDPVHLGPTRNAYESAVYGRVQSRSHLMMTVRVQVQHRQAGQPPQRVWTRAWNQVRDWTQSDYPESVEVWAVVDVQVTRPGAAPILQYQARVPMALSMRERPSWRLEPQGQAELAQQAGQWWLAVQDALDCEPLIYEAHQHTEDRFELMVGEDAGLRVGDRLVLADSRHVPRRLLEAQAAAHLALLEVERVDGQRARARQVAGPKVSQMRDAHWLAMPYGSSLIKPRAEVSP